MYDAYYHLSADPFRLSPDPRFCFEHPSFARARKYMQYALRRAEGFIMVTGRPGTGKTTLVESLLAGLASSGPVAARLVTAKLGPDELLRKVAYTFGLSAERLDKATLLHQLERFLSQQTRSGRGALLVIDEAQGLNASSLEELRLLTNLQENARPILQIFLVGQEELRDIVQAPELEQFHQRLIAACHLRPLDPDETSAYLEHRLRRVGWRGDPRITSDAVQLVHRFSAGVPRRINQVCSRLLLHGAAEGKHHLDGHDVLAVIEDLRAELLAPTDVPEGDELRDFLASLPSDVASVAVEDLGPDPAAIPSPAARAVSQGTVALDPTPAPEVMPRGPDGQPERTLESATPPTPPPAPARDARPELAPLPTPGRVVPPPRRSPVASRPARARHRFLSRVLPPLVLAGAAVALTLAVAPGPSRALATEVRARLEQLVERLAGPAPTVGGWMARQPPVVTGAPVPATSSADPPVRPVTAPAPPGPAARARTTPVEAVSEAPRPERAPAPEPPVHDPQPPVETVAQGQTAGSTSHRETAALPELAVPTLTPGANSDANAPPRGPDPLLAVRLGGAGGPERPGPAVPVAPSMVVEASVPTSSLPPPSRRGEADALEQDLTRLGLNVRRLGDGTLHVDLRRLVPFDFNSAEVRPESRPFLDRLAELIRRLDGFVVQVVGHTDDSGPRDYNVQLSRRRAEAVTAYLKQQGVPGSRLRAEGRGGSEPAAEVSDLSDGGPADQRRIELFINRLSGTRA